MQQIKDTKRNSDLEILTCDSAKLTSSLLDVMDKFNVKKNLCLFNFLKSKGLAVSSLLSILLILPFYGIANICQLMKCNINKLDIEAKKDAFYDLKNNENFNWRKLLLLHAKRFIYLVNNNIDIKSQKITALIFDDTLLEKSGKKIERISYVNDHVTGSYVLGYKLLVCGFWDGENFIPLDFSLHREKGKKQEESQRKYHKAAKNLEKQMVINTNLEEKLKKASGNRNNKHQKYLRNPNNINRIQYEKATQKEIETELQLIDNQKLLRQAYAEKAKATQELKRYYSTGSLFGLHSKERKEQYKKAVNPQSHGYTRRKETDKDKISCMLEMLSRVVKHGILPQYVLIDSWFFCYEILEKLKHLKSGALQLVCMVKINNQLFTNPLNNKEMCLKDILKTNQKKIVKCKKLKAEYIPVSCLYKGICVKLFFVRMGKCQTWHLLLTTNMDLNFIKLIEIYQIRWSIEVFFKESKQYLHLGGCQSNTFDAQIAEITISMMQHIMLSYFKRTHYQQSIGGLFKDLQKETIQLDLVSHLLAIFWELVELVCDLNGIDTIEFYHSIMKNNEITEKLNQLLPQRLCDKAA